MQTLLPEQRRFAGLMLVIFGMLCIIAAAGITLIISNARDDAAARFTEAQGSCRSRLQALGGRVEEAPGRLIWRKDNIEQAPVRLGEASVAAVLCPGWRLKSSCIGSDCPEANSMWTVLEPINAPSD